MEPITEPHAGIIMNTPLFRPEDVLLVEAFLETEQLISLLFEYCRSHVTGSYSFYDEMASMATEYEWHMDIELAIVDAINRMGSVLFYTLAINPILCILLVADIIDVVPMANNSWMVRYYTADLLQEVTTFNIGILNANGFATNPTNINYPNTTPGSWVSDILS